MKRLSEHRATVSCLALLLATTLATAVCAQRQAASWTILLDQGHPWRPPFGLDRVGRPVTARVERSEAKVPASDLFLSARATGREVASTPVEFAPDQTISQRVTLSDEVDEVVLIRRQADGPSAELACARPKRPELEAEAVAVADALTNPVDLGAILPPTGWLLLGPKQLATIDVAALVRADKPRTVQLAAWFEAAPAQKLTERVTLEPERCARVSLKGLAAPPDGDRSTLHVALLDADQSPIWRKEIPTMFVRRPPHWPAFGATETLLRYDAPISVRDTASGTFSTLSYDHAWRPELRDVVVSLPSGARFVFWRGSSYIPFWAGRHNTGLCYEWAEHGPPMPPGAVDCVEPLMDKELRYGRVEIVESTSARVHVRWSYQSNDFHYKTWGDAAVEDYYFYPDGFGTRVLNLKREPQAEYELSELILLTAANTPPLAVVPLHTVDALLPDGRKQEFLFPDLHRPPFRPDRPAVYRVRLHADEPLTAIYFNPYDAGPPRTIFPAFFDCGELVTPAYWGSHWPLARGNSTGWKIDDRMYITPCHTSLMSWASLRPRPLTSGRVPAIDALGRSREMVLERWAWLIGMTDAGDAELLRWARSFAQPPGLKVTGASIELNAYALERRALRLHVEQPHVKIVFEPSTACIHPVFELRGAPRTLAAVRLAGQPLAAGQYAWDGSVLWLDVDIDKTATLELQFTEAK